MTKETEAMKLIKARRGSYASDLGMFCDETELLLLSQHYSELAQQKAEENKTKKGR